MAEVLKTFNSTLLKFLDQLHILFPDSKAKTFHNVISLSPGISTWLKYFIDSSYEHGKEIMNKDEHYFLNSDIYFVEKLGLKEYYIKANQQIKDTMWRYIQTLFLLACNYSGYSYDFLNIVDKVANGTTENNISGIEKSVNKLK